MFAIQISLRLIDFEPRLCFFLRQTASSSPGLILILHDLFDLIDTSHRFSPFIKI